MSDRRCVLTQDTKGDVALWDLLTSKKISNLPSAYDKEVKKDANTKRLASWCQLDVSLGQLRVHLTAATALSCWSLVNDTIPSDDKMNLGGCVIQVSVVVMLLFFIYMHLFFWF